MMGIKAETEKNDEKKDLRDRITMSHTRSTTRSKISSSTSRVLTRFEHRRWMRGDTSTEEIERNGISVKLSRRTATLSTKSKRNQQKNKKIIELVMHARDKM